MRPAERYLCGMTLRKIALLGHPVLLARAEPVADVADPAVQRLIDDMLATMADADGIGLAAPQVYESLRIVVALELRDRGRARWRRSPRAGESRADAAWRGQRTGL